MSYYREFDFRKYSYLIFALKFKLFWMKVSNFSQKSFTKNKCRLWNSYFQYIQEFSIFVQSIYHCLNIPLYSHKVKYLIKRLNSSFTLGKEINKEPFILFYLDDFCSYDFCSNSIMNKVNQLFPSTFYFLTHQKSFHHFGSNLGFPTELFKNFDFRSPKFRRYK